MSLTEYMQDWGLSTQIWISALWMYYSSVLNLVECLKAWKFHLFRCHFLFLFHNIIGPYVLFHHKKKLSGFSFCFSFQEDSLDCTSYRCAGLVRFSNVHFGAHFDVHWMGPQIHWLTYTVLHYTTKVTSV